MTAGQYTEFLNKVASIDQYNLYHPDMWLDSYGCKIERFAGAGTAESPYQYRVSSEYASLPVTHVSWGDAARFVNWLHNGQPAGAQNLSTTEDGSYLLNGAWRDDELAAVSRRTNATWVIPTEDEWYKAAYHRNDGVTGNYFDYPTSSNDTPVFEPPPGGANSTNSLSYVGHTTDVGAYTGSVSPYGTFDQGGNVWEWNETEFAFAGRGTRGGCYLDFGMGNHNPSLSAADRNADAMANESEILGFRVAKVASGPDSDEDGVPDFADNCPYTVHGVGVDAVGCPPTIPGDFDRDGDVDRLDLGWFQVCSGGPAMPIPGFPSCELADLDHDLDVDQSDFGVFQRCFSGWNIPADPNCR